MSTFRELKEKATGFALNAAEKAKDLAGFAADKAKKAGRIAKLKLEISAEKDNIQASYTEIGKLYYETHKDAPEGFFLQLCEEVGAALAAIEAKEAELADLKSEIVEEAEDAELCDTPEEAPEADFDTVVSAAEEAPAAQEEPKDESPAEE